MATYRVNPDGRAPSGLSVGDLVVTGGGTYLITGFKNGGGYQSKLVDRETTTYNYKGAYAQAPSGNNTVGSGQIGATMSDLTAQYLQALNEMGKNTYQPAELPQPQTISFDDALSMAERAIAPQYQSSYQQAAANANQRLEQAGLYDTVYGQALAADAERDVTSDLNTAIVGLALQLSDASEQQAKDILELAIKERQFGADYNAQNKSNALKYLAQLIS